LPGWRPSRCSAPARVTRSSSKTKAKPKKRLAGLTIVLDPGHNGGNSSNPARLNAPVPAGGFTKPCNTAGAETNAGYPEHAFTWDVVSRTAKLLSAEGAKVVLTRHSDTGFGPCVNTRAAIGNAAHADAVVAVHADGAGTGQTGFHVIAPALAPDHGNKAILASSWRLALALHSAFHLATGENNATYVSGGLIRRADLAGLNLSRVPAVFIECANMRSSSDAAKVTSAAWRQKAAAGIVAGITAFLHR
jgi:N-acetylmuramoyl-L-alanine amidase